MLLDARAVPHASTLESDICIVGAGAAGIAIATELHERNVRVMLLESGDVTAHEATQALYDGTIAGRAYYPLRNCRSRQLGGTTATWGGWCRPLDSVDFTERAWMPHSGWPFPKQHLEPAYERAQRLCGLGPYDYDIAHWTALDAPPLVPDSPHFRETVLQIHATRFGEVYRARLESSGTVKVLLHANGLSLEMDPLNRTAERVRVATLNGNQFAVAAKRFVLATGGLENPRLLLASHGASDAGVGNEHDLVGRFFFDHLHVPVAHLRDQDGRFPSFYATHDVRGATVRGALGLTHDAMVGEQRYGFGVTFHNAKDPHDIFSLAQVSEGYDSLRYLAQSLARGDRPARALHHAASAVAGAGEIATIAWRKFVKPSATALIAGCRAEQAPNRESRVTLDASTDALGARRVRLDWRVSNEDLDQLEGAQACLVRELAVKGIELVKTPRDGADGWATRIAGGAHHMGTTRMHRDPTLGVVDEHCRVHGTSNVFVAGSSVFPTGGWAPPTLTIVALALRLADHLQAEQ